MTSGGHYHKIIFFRFCSEININQENCMFCVSQSSSSNNVSFNIILISRDYGVFIIGYLIAGGNPDPIKYYMDGIPIIVSNEQAILMLPINHSSIPMRNDLEPNKSNFFVIQHSIFQVGPILFLDKKCSGSLCDHQNFLLNNDKSCG